MRFLHVEDSKLDREIVQKLIERTRHWRYDFAASIAEGIEDWKNDHPQIVLIDLSFEGRSDQEAFDAIKTMSRDCNVIVVSGDHRQDTVNRVRDCGACAFINKDALTNPVTFHDAILEAVKVSLAKSSGSNEPDPLLMQLAEAVFYGNGRPSLMARTESLEGKMDLIISKLVDNNRGAILRFVATIVVVVGGFGITAYKVYKNQPTDTAQITEQIKAALESGGK